MDPVPSRGVKCHESVNGNVDQGIKDEFVEAPNLKEGGKYKHEIRECPYHPRHRVFGLRITVHLPQERKERGENADVPAHEDKDVHPVFLALDYQTIEQKDPR